jgi:hypothetical protein
MPQSPQVADTAPDEPFLTGYDMAHLVTYLRLLDADAEGADWREVAAIVLELDVRSDQLHGKGFGLVGHGPSLAAHSPRC